MGKTCGSLASPAQTLRFHQRFHREYSRNNQPKCLFHQEVKLSGLRSSVRRLLVWIGTSIGGKLIQICRGSRLGLKFSPSRAVFEEISRAVAADQLGLTNSAKFRPVSPEQFSRCCSFCVDSAEACTQFWPKLSGSGQSKREKFPKFIWIRIRDLA